MNLATCPHCGQQIQITAIKSRQKRRRFTEFESTNLQPATEAIIGGDWVRTTPIGRLETGDVTTALYNAGASFVLVTIGTAGVIWLLGGYIQIDTWRLDISYWLAPAWGYTVGMVRYFGGLKLAEGLLEIYESLTSPKETPPPPQPNSQTVEVKVSDGAGHWKYEELKVEPKKLKTLMLAILSGENFTERVATRASLTQEEFRELREQFISRGWAVWKHPTRKQQGVELTVSGKIIVRAISKAPLPPPLPG